MSEMKLRVLAAVVLTTLIATVAAGGLSGQEAGAPGAPRIGLVLSGGGARGAAHVGVLEVLEELRVPVHAIAGTSMGAVVGGLYAAGLDPDRLGSELAAVDWPEMLTDRLPRSALEYRRREEDREFLTQFELSVEGGIPRLPAGVVAGHNLEARLDRLLLPTAGTRDFDDLPIPFRATATDLATGDLVVLEAGDLSLAIRSSLSLPAVFAPVQLGDRLLVDGGVVRNLPVDVARAMGVDVLIVVDVGTPMVGREELRSLLDVSTQLMHILTQSNSEPERGTLGDEDVLLRPELGDLSILDFHRWEEAVLAGRQAALSLEGRLRELAVSPEAYAAAVERRRRASREPVVVQRVRVRPPAGMAAAALRNLVHVEPGRPLDPMRLEEGLLRLHGLRLFERIHVRLEGPPDSATLVIEPEPKAGGIHSLRFGLQVVDDFGAAQASYNVRSGLWLRNLNRQGGEARLEVELGEPRGALLELFQPLAPASPLALLARGEYRVAARYLAPGDSAASSRYRLSASRAALELALHPDAATQLRAGVFVGRRAGEPLAPATALEEFDDAEGGLTAALTMDRLDDAAFPHSGALLRLEWAGLREDLGTPVAYDRAEAALVGAIPVGRHTLILGAEAGARSPGFPAHDPYALGGLFRLSGQAGVADRLGGVARVAYLHDLGRGRIYAGASAEAGGVWPRARDISLDTAIPAGALLLGFRTLLGPVYVAGGYSRHGSFTAYVSVGRRVGQPW